MRQRRRKAIHEQEKSLGSQLLTLSLFVMLLAFFIILNAISSYEEDKTRPILKSLELAFASRITPQTDEMPSSSDDQDKSINEGDVLERIEKLFKAQIPLKGVRKNEQTGTLYMEVSYEEFANAIRSIVPESSDAQASGTAKAVPEYFLPTLVALVRTDKAGLSYRMDMILNVPANPASLQNLEPQKMIAYTKDLGDLMSRLERAGLPQKLMTAGIGNGKEGVIEVMFRPHLPYNPLQDDEVTEE